MRHISNVLGLFALFATVPTWGQDISSLGAGTDRFDIIVEMKADLHLPGDQNREHRTVAVETVGPVTVVRGDPRRENGGVLIETEIVSMSLTGFHPGLGEIKVEQSPEPDRRTLGEIRIRRKGQDFHVDSFFDVFFDVTVHLGDQHLKLQNMPAVSGETTINRNVLWGDWFLPWPPLDQLPYVHTPPPEPIKLVAFTPDGEELEFGVITAARVIPTQAAHASLKRELILLERLVHRLLRLHKTTDSISR